MAFATRTRLGPYEIVAPLGAGGMGEVYRAHDTKLNREVALKVLPQTFVDGDRVARFRHEAQVLASLNHPNIAAIYGFEDGNGVYALVLELVDGPTLADRIAQGAVPLEEALPIARQIADALEAAHEQGIIHRDLKPANIKVRDDGKVKVLDFGLAKAFDASTSTDAAAAMSPTVSVHVTQPGLILGTAAYMAPEQARGQPLDKRADIWAFGCVLLEMLDGHPAFRGETISDTVAAVLTAQPDSAGLPEPIRTLVGLCLVKDPKQRLRDIGDARLLLTSRMPIAGTAAESRRQRLLPWALTVASIVALVAVALAATVVWRRASETIAQASLALSVDLGQDAIAGRDVTVAITRDGSRIAFPARMSGGKEGLATRLLSDPRYSVLPGTNDAKNPFFSPDGRWIGFFANGQLKKVAVEGGAPISLCDAPGGRGGTWGEDGYIIAALATTTGLARVPENGGTPEAVTDPTAVGHITDRWPQHLQTPAVIFTSHSVQANFDDATIDVVSLTTRQRKTVVRGGYFGRYVPTGHLVYMRGSTLFAVPFDLKRLEVTGVPVPVIENIAGSESYGGGQFDFSQNGTFVFLHGSVSTDTEAGMYWMEKTGATEPLPLPGHLSPRFSPDGKQLVVTTVPEFNLWVYDIARRSARQLTFETGAVIPPTAVWAPDGQHIAYGVRTGSTASLRWIRSDGAASAVSLLERKDRSLIPYSFTPDGRRLAFGNFPPAGRPLEARIAMLPLDATDADHPKAGQPEQLWQTSAGEFEPAISPDGRWIAYLSTESRDEATYRDLFVRSFAPGTADPGGRWKISSAGSHPVWSHMGHQLLYHAADRQVMVVDYTVRGNAFEAGTPRPWSEHPERRLPRTGPIDFDILPNGTRLIIAADADQPSDPQRTSLHAMMLVNWFNELKARVPTK